MEHTLPRIDKVAILGVGLLGGSIGLALRRAGFAGQIAGFGHRQSSLDAAIEVGAASMVSLDIAPVVAQADLVILASPIGRFAPLLEQMAGYLADDAIVTDVGSTKQQVVAQAGRLLRGRPARFVGAHPIAGSDRRGVQYARADLFDGACCVLTPTRSSEPAAVETVDKFWQALGMWTMTMSPAQHDRCLAEISHLPHATAAVLMLISQPDAQDLAGGGFLDSTRIAGGDPELWRDIFLTNGKQVARSIRRFGQKLARLGELIDRGDGPGIVKLLADAQQRRHELMNRRLQRRRVEG